MPYSTDQLMPTDLQHVLHDLRTPLNQIIGFSEMLQEIADDESRLDLREGLGGVCEAAIELTTLLSNARLIAFASEAEPDYWRLIDAARLPISRVLGFAEVILREPVEAPLTQYASDLTKVQTAAVQFLEKARTSNVVVKIEAVRDLPPVASGRGSSSTEVAGRILIVDDENLNREILCRRLQREGYTPVGVASGQAALEAIERETFDIVLLDILMPGIGGMEVLRMLKRDEKTRHIPVLMLSALSDVDRVARCVELGADDYLPKPVNSVLLRARLGACLEKKRLRDQEQANLRALDAEKKLLSVTIQSLADAVVTTDQDGRIMLFNNVAVIMTGFSEKEARGKLFGTVFPIFNQTNNEPVADAALEAITLRCAVDSPHGALLKTFTGDRLVATHSAPIHHPDGGLSGTVVIIRDVTEKEKITSEVLRSSKLESIGVLAGGLAHDFNNMLTAVIGNLSLIRHSVHGDAELTHRLDEAEGGALRARDLAQCLLTFAEGGAPLKEIIEPAALLRETTEFVASGSRVNCEFSVASKLWPVEADASQLRQAISSIVINAQQAMPEGGTIYFTAKNILLEDDVPTATAAGPYVSITIADTGIGIAPEHLDRIYDPFFTTRNQARGLGLAAAYSILHRHGGHIDVKSTLGRGTTFSLFLPAQPPQEKPRKEAVQTRLPETPEAPNAPTRRFKVLLMDDEEAIRMVCSSMLDILGYDAITAIDGTEAVEFFAAAEKSGAPFDLVISDLTVPGGMGGAEAIRRIRESGSSVPAIVSSGYSSGPVMSNPAEYGFNAVLPKPYRMSDLEAVLQKIALR